MRPRLRACANRLSACRRYVRRKPTTRVRKSPAQEVLRRLAALCTEHEPRCACADALFTLKTTPRFVDPPRGERVKFNGLSGPPGDADQVRSRELEDERQPGCQ